MKSVAIFLTLVFLTGFQAAVLSEEPPPSILEPNQTFLEQVQDHAGKLSTQVTNSINGGVEMMKQRVSEMMTSLKKLNIQKIPQRKFFSLWKDIQQGSQNAISQSKEVVSDHYKKANDLLEEVKNHHLMVALHEEMVGPLTEKCTKLANWIGEQSGISLYNMVFKKFGQLKPTAP